MKEDNWSIYERKQENGERWIIRKNLNPIPQGEKNNYPICIYFTIHYEPHTEEGFPSAIDLDAFELIENNLASICNGEHSTLVGTVLMPKLKDFIIYTSAPDKLCNLLESKFKKYSQFNFDFSGHDDTHWSQYEAFA